MKVTSGKYAFRTLAGPRETGLRPTASILKQAVFNILRNDITEHTFLDLFAGTGQMGIEALSQGAKKAVFVDNGPESGQLLEKNTAFLEQGTYRFLPMDFERACKLLQGEAFTVIFADPPYQGGLYGAIQRAVEKNGLLAPGGRLLLEHDSALDILILPGYNKEQTKVYGKRAFTLLTEREKS